MPQSQSSFLDRVTKALHLHHDEIVSEPLPQRWIDLISYLNEKERRSGQNQPIENEPTTRRRPSN